jgi:mercuric ion transport protein
MTGKVARMRQDIHTGHAQRRQRVAAAGGVLGAIGATSCCILPLILFTLGASGPWIGNLVQLAPYQPHIIGVTIGCLGCGYWLVYRSQSSCKVSGRASDRLVKYALILATVLVIAAIGFNLLAPLLNS